MINYIRLKSDFIRLVLTILTGLIVISMLLSRYLDFGIRSKLLAMTASSGFVLIGLVSLIKYRTKYEFLILIGLIFCWFGDYFSGFKITVISFFLAHLNFIFAFLSCGINKIRPLKITPLVIIFSGIIAFWLYPHVPKADQIFVLGYMIIISIMVVFAFGIREPNIIIILGAILFYISDIFVARWRFVDASSINGVFCYPLYYGSCILFALSNGLKTKMIPCNSR